MDKTSWTDYVIGISLLGQTIKLGQDFLDRLYNWTRLLGHTIKLDKTSVTDYIIGTGLIGQSIKLGQDFLDRL